jgi:hypothetical protein
MGDIVRRGGFIITTSGRTYVSNKDIDQATLLKVAELLGIEPAHKHELGPETFRTIFIYTSDKS